MELFTTRYGIIYQKIWNYCISQWCCEAGATAAWSHHFLGGAGAEFYFGRSRDPEPPLSFWQAKKEPFVVTIHDLRAIYNGKCDPKKDLH